jgi:hypothetical protein
VAEERLQILWARACSTELLAYSHGGRSSKGNGIRGTSWILCADVVGVDVGRSGEVDGSVQVFELYFKWKSGLQCSNCNGA